MAKSNSLDHTYGLPLRPAGTGPSSAGQAGDTQGLSDTADVGDESVMELVEEGQSFEANILMGVENALDRETKPVRTREVPEDDVPAEYQDEVEPPRDRTR